MATATTTRPVRASTKGVPHTRVVNASRDAALDLVDRSRSSLVEACGAEHACDRYELAHVGALRAAAAVLAARGMTGRRSKARSVWAELPSAAHELREWAEFFTASAHRRAALKQGRVQVSVREADDLLRQTALFCEHVRGVLGLPFAEPLPAYVVATRA